MVKTIQFEINFSFQGLFCSSLHFPNTHYISFETFILYTLLSTISGEKLTFFRSYLPIILKEQKNDVRWKKTLANVEEQKGHVGKEGTLFKVKEQKGNVDDTGTLSNLLLI